MKKIQSVPISIEGNVVQYVFDGSFRQLAQWCDKKNTILVTDENVMAAHASLFAKWKTIVLKAGEVHKQQAAVDLVIQQLMRYEADRSTTLVGVGGGVVTDIAGYAGAVYMRGIRTGFVPTTLLAMVDAAIGGKNGVDAGIYKNLIGTIRQPAFLLYDVQLLQSLPALEWQNGFAEIIKHAAIKNAALFKWLEKHDISFFQSNTAALQDLVQQNSLLKTKVVQKDPLERGDRKLLNFGHTIGHAIENEQQLSHGHAVAIGMVYAAHLSQRITGFSETIRLIQLIEKYGLPTHTQVDMERVLHNMRHDKKRKGNAIHFVLLEKIGKGMIQSIAIAKLRKMLLA